MIILEKLRQRLSFFRPLVKKLRPLRTVPTGPIPISGLPPAHSKKERILIFAPEADVHPHSHAMWVSGRILQEQGYEVWLTRCHGHLNRCPVMGASRLPFDISPSVKQPLCDKCVQHSHLAEEEYGLPILDWRAIDTSTINACVDAAIATLPEDLSTATHDGFSVGLLASFEVRLGLKVSYLDPQDSDVRFAWTQLIRSAIFSYEMVRAHIQAYGFKHVIYFNDYAIMLAAGLAAKREGANPTLVTLAAHRGVDFRRYVLRPLGTYPDIFRIDHEWDTWRNLSLPAPLVKEIQEDLMVRFGGQGKSVHIYSAAKNDAELPKPTEQFPGGPLRRRLVAYTSSPDEYAGVFALMDGLNARVTTPQLVFGGDVADCHTSWLNALVKHVASRPDLELIVRVHPREGANRRESQNSSHLLLLQSCLRDLPENVRVIWPHEPISSYDLAETADLILTTWSTIGIEFARLGMPALASSKGISGHPIDDYMQHAETPELYFSRIDELITTPPSLTNLTRSVRAWNAFVVACSVDFTDIIPTPNYWDLPKFRMPKEAEQFRQVVIEKHSILDLNRKRLEKHTAKKGAPEEEEREIRLQARRFAVYLISGKDLQKDPIIWYVQKDVPLERLEALKKDAKIPGRAIIISGDHWVNCSKEGSVRKFSPMVARLAFLGAQFVTTDSHWRLAVPVAAHVVDITLK